MKNKKIPYLVLASALAISLPVVSKAEEEARPAPASQYSEQVKSDVTEFVANSDQENQFVESKEETTEETDSISEETLVEEKDLSLPEDNSDKSNFVDTKATENKEVTKGQDNIVEENDLTVADVNEAADKSNDKLNDYNDKTQELINKQLEEREKEKNGQEVVKEENDYAISIITDTHILIEDMIANTPEFDTALHSDRKMFTESQGLLAQALENILGNGTKYILIPGDLTKDGEKLNHQYLAGELGKWKAVSPGRQVIIVPGNHDINNPIFSEDYTKENPQETPTVNHKEFMEIYKDLVYDNKDILLSKYIDSDYYKKEAERVNKIYSEKNDGKRRDEEYADLVHGYVSFSSRFSNNNKETDGITVIGIDSTNNTPEVLDHGKDGLQETPGSISYAQMRWIYDEIEKANKRNDVVILLGHHASLSHFNRQNNILSPYIIKGWETPFLAKDYDPNEVDERIEGKTLHEILEELNVSLHFTGHLHVQDIAATRPVIGENREQLLDKNGNPVYNYYDIATGSLVTYPVPIRKITITNNISSEDPHVIVDIDSKSIGRFEYNDANKNHQIVEDAKEYSYGDAITKDLLKNYFFNYVVGKDNSLDDITTEAVKEKINPILSSLIKDAEIDLTKSGYGNDLLKYAYEKGIIPKELKLTDAIKATIKVDDKGKLTVSALTIKASTTGDKIENYLDEVLNELTSKVITDENINNLITNVVDALMNAKLVENNDQATLSRVANDAYNTFLHGDENNIDGSTNRFSYIDDVINEYRNSDKNVLEVILRDASETIDNEVYRNLQAVKINDLYDSLLEVKGLFSSTVSGVIKNVINDYGLKDNFETIYKGKLVQDLLWGILNPVDEDDNATARPEGEIVSPTDLLIYGVKSEGGNKFLTNTIAGMLQLNPVDADGNPISLTNLVIDLLDDMTNENTERYKYKFFADNDAILNLPVSGSIGEIVVKQNNDKVLKKDDLQFELAHKINFNEYALNSIDISLNGDNVESIDFKNPDSLKELVDLLNELDNKEDLNQGLNEYLKAKLSNLDYKEDGDNTLVLKYNLTNKFGNSVTSERKLNINFVKDLPEEGENPVDNPEKPVEDPEVK
ncbi:MAG: metallophosphoesterase [Finegoldia sp.]|nr:metallophosphoesterase [Finegoldia sp.]